MSRCRGNYCFAAVFPISVLLSICCATRADDSLTATFSSSHEYDIPAILEIVRQGDNDDRTRLWNSLHKQKGMAKVAEAELWAVFQDRREIADVRAFAGQLWQEMADVTDETQTVLVSIATSRTEPQPVRMVALSKLVDYSRHHERPQIHNLLSTIIEDRNDCSEIRAWSAMGICEMFLTPAALENTVVSLKKVLLDQSESADLRLSLAETIRVIHLRDQKRYEELVTVLFTIAARRDEARRLRIQALDSLAQVGMYAVLLGAELETIKKQAIPWLIATLKDKTESKKLRDAAGDALGSLGAIPADKIADLVAILNGPEAFARPHAAAALGEVGPAAQSIVPVLRKIADDESQTKETREAAAEAIETIESDSADDDSR